MSLLRLKEKKSWGSAGWGYNIFGQPGDAYTTDRHVPVEVGGGQIFNTLSMHGDHSCCLSDAGTILCWGYNAYGTVGDGTIFDRTTPTQLSGF
ncbi:hypothetical protein KKF84_12565 [Myxococcota bacterium]|nr:hypothetical protein [Myxococcota bacterium]MBU1536148.1 hypothetical protein [Myxococcota bacterium]